MFVYSILLSASLLALPELVVGLPIGAVLLLYENRDEIRSITVGLLCSRVNAISLSVG